MVLSMVKPVHDFGTVSEWIYLQSSLNRLVARVLPWHMSWMSKLFLMMAVSILVATVTSLSRKRNRGLFMRSSVRSSLCSSLGRIYKYLLTFSLTSDSHFS